MYRSEVISVLYEQNLISFYINTLGPFSRALSQIWSVDIEHEIVFEGMCMKMEHSHEHKVLSSVN